MNYGNLDGDGEMPHTNDHLSTDDDGPTFEDLAIDDSLSDVDRVTKYVCSNIALQRVMHVKMLCDTATTIGYRATCDRLLPLLEPLVSDNEYVVRQHVAFQFPSLCTFLVSTGSDAGYRTLLELMIPLVTRLVSDDQHDVRAAASESLVDMAALVRPEDQGQHILTIVLPLAHDDDNEQFRISAVALYNGLAEYFGPELCQQFCVPELISLSEDPVFRVRKSTAQSFRNVCKVAGPTISRDRLVPAFLKLARDDIWGVRKTCAENLVGLALALDAADRGPLLLPVFEAFVADSSRWVRMAAFQALGPFVVALAPEDVSDSLIDHFISMATTVAAQLGGSGEADIKFHCAFNLPAIATVVGALKWEKVAPTFALLSVDTFWKVRRTIAYSLHELARLLGPAITQSELAPAFDRYLLDIPDVQLGAMRHFCDFVACVEPEIRTKYLPVLTLFTSQGVGGTKWRVRAVVSEQLAQLCTLFSDQATFEVIYPLVKTLVTDSVAVVRQASYHACPLLIARLESHPEWQAAVVAQWIALGASRHFSDRQTLVHICEAFVKDDDSENKSDAATTDDSVDTTGDTVVDSVEARRAFFAVHLAPAFFALASDAVSNVRVVFAAMLRTHHVYLTSCSACPSRLTHLLHTTTFGTTEALLAALPTAQKTRTPAAADASDASEASTELMRKDHDPVDETTDEASVVDAVAVLALDDDDTSLVDDRVRSDVSSATRETSSSIETAASDTHEPHEPVT